MKIAEEGNKYLALQEPWKKVKHSPREAENILANCAKAILCLAILIHPFLPKSSQKISAIFGGDWQNWTPQKQNKFKVSNAEIIFEKIEDELIDKQIAKLKGGTKS